MKTNEMGFFLNIGNRLTELRIKAGYSRAENFALAYGLNPSTYYKWERGDRICVKNLIRICDVLDITIAEFFQSIKQPTMS